MKKRMVKLLKGGKGTKIGRGLKRDKEGLNREEGAE